MLVACLLTSLLFMVGQCQHSVAPNLQKQQQKDLHLKPYHQIEDSELNQCIIGILDKYFSRRIELTYVSINSDDEVLLKAIHTSMKLTLVTRQPTKQMSAPNLGYLVSSTNAADFTEYFQYLLREPEWNPSARFLIVIKSIEDDQLRLIFDELLTRHVINVLVVNGTECAHLYTYNPFDNYGCGKRYTNVINYGLCSEAKHFLYPHKLVTGLKNCNLIASLPNRPPYTIDPSISEDIKTSLGTEEFIITVLAEIEHFTVTFFYDYDGEQYSTVAPNMTAIGPMDKLQRNEVDLIFGGMMMVASRAQAFSFLCGYHDYSDDMRFIVKKSPLVPIWRLIYLEFEPDVWIVLLVGFAIYSVLLIVLLRTKDWGDIILRMLDSLLLHCRHVDTRLSVNCVIVIWVWFAFLINTIYQSCLFSLTTQPSVDFQISNEAQLLEYGFQPCFTAGLQNYISTENKFMKRANFQRKGCKTTGEAMETVMTTPGMFTLCPNYFYLYNEGLYKDKWGDSSIYYFDKPFAKFLFGFFFYKGFPVTKRLQLNAQRMRESGLADKSLQDHYFKRRIKQKFHQKTFETRFLFPWSVCLLGTVIASIIFILELLSKHTQWVRCPHIF